jgi:hypothetical protein
MSLLQLQHLLLLPVQKLLLLLQAAKAAQPREGLPEVAGH